MGEEGCASKLGLQSVKIGFSVPKLAFVCSPDNAELCSHTENHQVKCKILLVGWIYELCCFFINQKFIPVDFPCFFFNKSLT